jgi:hypothetical protein
MAKDRILRWLSRRRALRFAGAALLAFGLACGGAPQAPETPAFTPTPAPPLSPTPAPTDTPLPMPTPAPAADSEALRALPGADCVPPGRPVQQARLVRVLDGDTIEVEIEGRTYRVRYIGIDAPERGQAFYAEAASANRRLVEGKPYNGCPASPSTAKPEVAANAASIRNVRREERRVWSHSSRGHPWGIGFGPHLHDGMHTAP